MDPLDAADDDSRRLDRRAQLQSADIFERGLEAIAGRAAEGDEIADLEREEENRGNADRNEDPDPEIDRVPAQDTPLNMKTVSTKSSARIASELSTTVRVVALETPSAVGFAS